MTIRVTASWIIRPSSATPATTLWLSPVDTLAPSLHHTRVVYMYRRNGADNFFDAVVLKEALGQALVHFYPMAGRLKWRKDLRLEVDCNGEGAVFVEAEYDGLMNEFGDFRPSPELSRLVPVANSSGEISACPLLLLQVTRFKCGGVCLGFSSEHHLCDGISVSHFMETWSGIARGVAVAIPPFFDKRAAGMCPRDRPQPKFKHVEYQPPPKIVAPLDDVEPRIPKSFPLNRDQINALKAKCANIAYTSFEAMVAHTLRNYCIARHVPRDQELKLYISVDGRTRLQPPLPRGYFGNAVFYATVVATAGELESDTLKVTANRIREAMARMDDEYLRSALDYLESRLVASPTTPIRQTYHYPNLTANSWARFNTLDTDFGWGRPIHYGFADPSNQEKIIIHPTTVKNGTLSVGISLTKNEMERFEKLFYRTFDDACSKL